MLGRASNWTPTDADTCCSTVVHMPQNFPAVCQNHSKSLPAPGHLPQVHQARLLMELEAGPGAGPLTGPDGLLEAAAALWGATVRRVHISEFHADVAAQLRAMGLPCVTAPLTSYLLCFKHDHEHDCKVVATILVAGVVSVLDDSLCGCEPHVP